MLSVNDTARSSMRRMPSVNGRADSSSVSGSLEDVDSVSEHVGGVLDLPFVGGHTSPSGSVLEVSQVAM